MAVALVAFGAGIVLSNVTAGVAEAATGYKSGSSAPLPLAVTVADLVGLWIALVAAAVWFSRSAGTGSLAADYGYRARWWDLFVGAAIGLACQYGLIRLIYAPFEHADHTLTDRLNHTTQRQVGAVHSPAAVVVLVLFLAVGAPLVEELFFRGMLLRSLAGWISPAPAVVVGGVLFGLAHFELLQLAGLVAFGIVLGAVAWKLQRLGPTVAAHMAFNAAAVLTTVHLHG